MKLAFSGQGRYADFDEGYALYVKRSKLGNYVDEATYRRIVKAYCKMLSDKLYDEGMIDLPSDLGSVAAATITKKPQYRGNKFIGYGKKDWKTGHYDGKLKSFGMVFLPRRGKNANLRSYGFVANRKLFKKMSTRFHGYDSPWRTIEFNDEMV